MPTILKPRAASPHLYILKTQVYHQSASYVYTFQVAYSLQDFVQKLYAFLSLHFRPHDPATPAHFRLS